MSHSLEVRRQKVVRRLKWVKGKIAAMEKQQARIQTRLMAFEQSRPKAA
jgi:hypothetical protein